MMQFLSKHTLIFFIAVLVLIGSIVRLYNLNWGAPFYFHPDERNIASSVSQLRFSDSLNPHFFAYGSLPIYAIYGAGLVFQTVHGIQAEPGQVLFESAIIIGRSFSALLGILLLPLLFLLGKTLRDTTTGLITLLLGVTSTGLIQFSHFGTFELWLTFFSLLLFYLCLVTYKRFSILLLTLQAIVFGVLLAIKVSSLVLLPLQLLALVLAIRRHSPHVRTLVDAMKRIVMFFLATLFFFAVAAAVYIATNPYVLLDTKSFLGSIRYESGVALGTITVFYTGEFFETVPGLYHFLYIYPFLINPVLTLLFVPAFCFLSYHAVRKKHMPYIFLLLFFLTLFLSQIFLFVKWVRYLVPTLPFLYLILSLAASEFFRTVRSSHDLLSLKLTHGIQVVVIAVCFVFSLSYVITAFVETDTRIAAAEWASSAIPSDASILSEVYDLGITPFNPHFSDIDLFHFYDLDNNSFEASPATLNEALQTHQYIVLPSQRILKTRLTDEKRFPNGHAFYTKLFHDDFAFEKIYQTPCSIFCKIAYVGNPVFSLEGTANLFDRPTVYIFRVR